MEPQKELLELMFGRMVTIRKFEEKAIELVDQGKILGEVHAYIGEEASGVGVCAALNDRDYITSTHRGHGHVIAKGADVRGMMAELMGKKTGLCKGKGGSMHIADVSLGILGANGIVGGGLPIAVGAGLAAHLLKDNRVAVSFFGDGASNQGVFHESMNLAACWKLPVVFVCEDNKYHEFSSSVPLIAGQLINRAKAYDMAAQEVDGQDVLAVYNVSLSAVERARQGEGPTLIVSNTYRFTGHMVGEEAIIPAYRTQAEVDEWKKRDPIEIFSNYLIENHYFNDSDLDNMFHKIDELIEDAVEFGETSPLPDPAEAMEDLFI